MEFVTNGSSKFASFSVFCKLDSRAPNATDSVRPSFSPRKNSPDLHQVQAAQEQSLARVGVRSTSWRRPWISYSLATCIW